MDLREFWGIKVAWGVCEDTDKNAGHDTVPPLKLEKSSGREVGGMRSVAVKCIVSEQNSDYEGSLPAPI